MCKCIAGHGSLILPQPAMLCKVSKPPTSNINQIFVQVGVSWRSFDPLQMNMFPSKETNWLQSQEIVNQLPSIHAHVNCLACTSIQSFKYKLIEVHILT